ncbi:MAG: serine/threonine protein kinase, partial [Myxococcales bacterium]|nr:serine/threonine protein kinase [Myxococcales bacterium]
MLEIVEEEIGSGAVVAGEYRLDEKLGEGGMGVVWRATHLPSGDRCAVKLLKAGRETEPKNQARLAYEARAAMAVEHPNVARVRAVLETEAGAPFIVMDLLDGEPLRDYLQKHTSLDVARCAAIFEGVIAGVRAAHERGVVHRDLKPENVFLTPSGVKVLDFGIAKKLRRDDEDAGPPSLTSTGTVLGTPAYMAPEQLFGERDLDARADVWALGVMLDEALTGVHPFGREMGQVLKAITQGLRRPLGERRPDLPPALCAVVDAMVTRDTRARPSLEDVATVLAGGELAPATAPLPPPTRGAITAPDVPPVTQRTTP